MAKPIKSYQGNGLNVTFEPARCIHAKACVNGLPEVFDTARRPWILPQAAPAEQVADVVARCPSGALHIRPHDETLPPEAPDAENTIQVQPDGPLYLRGDLDMVGMQGEPLRRDTRLALCRCGASQHKPYCDNQHLESGFQDPGKLSKTTFAVADYQPGGALTVTPSPNGPLLVGGAVRILSADGSASVDCHQCALCRCGSSKKKPFCDGTHKKIGFTAD